MDRAEFDLLQTSRGGGTSNLSVVDDVNTSIKRTSSYWESRPLKMLSSAVSGAREHAPAYFGLGYLAGSRSFGIKGGIARGAAGILVGTGYGIWEGLYQEYNKHADTLHERELERINSLHNAEVADLGRAQELELAQLETDYANSPAIEQRHARETMELKHLHDEEKLALTQKHRLAFQKIVQNQSTGTNFEYDKQQQRNALAEQQRKERLVLDDEQAQERKELEKKQEKEREEQEVQSAETDINDPEDIVNPEDSTPNPDCIMDGDCDSELTQQIRAAEQAWMEYRSSGLEAKDLRCNNDTLDDKNNPDNNPEPTITGGEKDKQDHYRGSDSGILEVAINDDWDPRREPTLTGGNDDGRLSDGKGSQSNSKPYYGLPGREINYSPEGIL